MANYYGSGANEFLVEKGLRIMNVTRGMHSGGLGRTGRIALVVLVAVGMSLAWTSPVSAMKPPPNQAKNKLKKTIDVKSARQGGELGQQAAVPKVVPFDPNAPRSRAVVDEKMHDFGTHWIGPSLLHTFKIKNEGDAVLEIKSVKPSCGCTVAGAYPKEIKPGETGEFPFSVKSTRLRGKFVKAIAINTNDPDNVSMRVQLKGEVKQYVEVVPPNVYLGKMRADEPTERVLKISNNTDKPLELAIGEKMKGNYDVEIVTKEPGQLFELHVTAKPPYPEGPFREWLKLTTNIEEQKEIKIDVRGTVPQRIEVSPQTLTLGQRGSRAADDKPITRIVRLTNYGRNPLKLREAKVQDDAEITTTINEQVEGKAYTVELKFPVGYTLPPLGRKLVMLTDDRSHSRLVVPIVDYQQKEAVLRPAEQLVGTPAPKVNVKTAAGAPLSNTTMEANVTVLDFFAPNCGFCKKQIPRLDEVREKYSDKGVRFIAVAQTMRNKKYTDEQVAQLIDQLGFKGELVLDQANTLGPRFKATSYPTMVVIGKDAKIAAVNLGNIGDLEKRLGEQLDGLLGIKPSEADAVTKKTETAPPPAPKPAKRQSANDLVGKPAAKFSMTSLDGKVVSSDEFGKNSATVLNFVAVNCGYCGKQIPRLEAIRKKYEGKGVRFVNMVETMRQPFTKDDVVAKMTTLGSKLEAVHDVDNKVGPDYGARGFPTMVVVGKSGNVEAVNVGNIGDLETRLATQLDAVIAGKPVPKVAAAPTPQRKRPADLLGKPAPKFTMTNFDGKTVTSDDFGKHPATVLNFVAVNCGYCGKQIPRLEAMRKKYEEKGVRFVNMVETMRTKFTKEDVVAKMTTMGSNLEVVHDLDNKVGPGYGAGGFPTMVVVGKSGNIEALNVGNIADLETRLATQLDALIDGKPVPKTAAAPPRRQGPEDNIGKTAPKFTMTSLDGKTVSSDDFGKHPATVLNFVATNCGYCSKQIPRLEKMREKYESKGIRFVNMVETMRTKSTEEVVVKKMTDLGSKLEVVHDADNKVGPGYGARGFPTMVVVGKSGKIEAVNVGNIGDLETRLAGQLDALIAGKPLPKVATAAPQPRRRPAEDTVGKPAPTFAVTTMDGKSVSNATFKDHPATVLNFVAPNCGFCKRALPNVEKVRKDYEAKGIRFVNVVQKMRKEFTEEQIVDVLKEAGSRLAISTSDFKDNTVGQAFKAVSYPTMVVVDRTGKIAHVNIGAKQNLDSLLKGQLDALMK
jgi:thiol-disulfide isomerase/thioredoxin